VYKAWDKAGRPAGPFVFRKQTFNGSMLKSMFEPLPIPPPGPVLASASPEALEAALAKQKSDLATLQTKALALWKKDGSNARELGAVLNQVKHLMPHGGFAKWLEANKVDRNRASYCMRLDNGKQENAKDKTPTARAKWFDRLNDALSDMYAYAQKRDAEKAQKLYNEIKRILDSLLQEATLPPKNPSKPKWSKDKASAAHA